MPIPVGGASVYDPTSDVGLVRMLVNDVSEPWVFTDVEITAFLALEGGVVKLAAAQALDTVADDEALTSKVIATQDLRTDGAKVADALRKRADALREQAYGDDDYFEVVDLGTQTPVPELTEQPSVWPWS